MWFARQTSTTALFCPSSYTIPTQLSTESRCRNIWDTNSSRIHKNHLGRCCQLAKSGARTSKFDDQGENADQRNQYQRDQAQDAPGRQNIGFDISQIQGEGESGNGRAQQPDGRFDSRLPESCQNKKRGVSQHADAAHRNPHNARVFAAVHDIATELLADIAELRRRLRVVALERYRRYDHPRQRENCDQQKEDSIAARQPRLRLRRSVRGSAHGRLHPVLSLRAPSDKTPSFGGSVPNCQLGNSFAPAILHSGANSFESLIAHST